MLENKKFKQADIVPDFTEVKMEIELQYRDRETDMEETIRRVTEDYARRGNSAGPIKSMQVYLKPTDFTAYYVINDAYEGKVPLF